MWLRHTTEEHRRPPSGGCSFGSVSPARSLKIQDRQQSLVHTTEEEDALLQLKFPTPSIESRRRPEAMVADPNFRRRLMLPLSPPLNLVKFLPDTHLKILGRRKSVFDFRPRLYRLMKGSPIVLPLYRYIVSPSQ